MNKKSALSIIFITVFIDLMGFGLLIPILPTFASIELGISDFEIGIIVAIYSFMQFVFNPMFGKLSDKYGRRPLILSTLLLTATSYIIFSFSTNFWILALSRVIGGLGGSNIGVAQAYIADITTKEERSKGMGLIGAAFGLGFVFGPVVGALLSQYGYAFAGYGSAAFSLLAFSFAFFKLPESRNFEIDSTVVRPKIFDLRFTIEVIKRKNIGFLIILFSVIVFSMANIYGTFSILGYKYYHFSDMQNGLLFAIIGIVGAIIQGGFIKQLAKMFNDRNLILLGTIFMIIGLAAIPYGQNFFGVAVAGGILAIGTGMLQPTILSMVSKYSHETEQGSILGINQSFSALARVLGPVWGGFSFHYLGYQAPFLTGSLFALLTFLATFFFFNTNKAI
ncbi:MAG: MFS transporter [Ignavibacteriaceae bacterium]|jgi:multidrug resistance protein|nr:MFS transporter [Ignavibacteriaceae bacterium]